MKNIYFILFIFLNLGFFNLSYGCDKKITSKDFILFVDMNGGAKEIEEAKKAACSKGQELIVYPVQSEKFFKLKKESDSLLSRMDSLKCVSASTSETCAKLLKKIQEVSREKSNEIQRFEQDELHENLEKLSQEGRHVNMLVMSGHGDAHSVYGDYGASDYSDIHDIFNNLDDKGRSVNSLIMLSCYSANPYTIIEWKKNLTELKMIAGSDASAPASDRPAGLKYLKDLMVKVNEITADVDEKKFKKKLQVLIPTLNQVNSAIYIDGNKCGEGLSEKRLFFSKSNGGVKIFNPEDCIKAETEYKKKEIKITEYKQGKIAIPLETQGTELREIYTFLRQNEHCLEVSQTKYSANMVYGLLFYNSIKINAIKAYKKEADVINATMELERNEKSPMPAQYKSDFEKIWPLNEENIRKKGRGEILQALESIKRLGSTINDDQRRYSFLEAYSKLDESLNEMTCISNQWHSEQVKPTVPQCEEREDEDIDL